MICKTKKGPRRLRGMPVSESYAWRGPVGIPTTDVLKWVERLEIYRRTGR